MRQEVLISISVDLGLLGEQEVEVEGLYRPGSPGCFDPFKGGEPPSGPELDVQHIWLKGLRPDPEAPIDLVFLADENALEALIDRCLDKYEEEAV